MLDILAKLNKTSRTKCERDIFVWHMPGLLEPVNRISLAAFPTREVSTDIEGDRWFRPDFEQCQLIPYDREFEEQLHVFDSIRNGELHELYQSHSDGFGHYCREAKKAGKESTLILCVHNDPDTTLSEVIFYQGVQIKNSALRYRELGSAELWHNFTFVQKTVFNQ